MSTKTRPKRQSFNEIIEGHGRSPDLHQLYNGGRITPGSQLILNASNNQKNILVESKK